MTERSTQAEPNFTEGVPLADVVEGGMVKGHVDGESAILVRQKGELFAVGAVCTHYGAPLVNGLLVGDTIRCPWHHACFSLRTGQVLRPPAAGVWSGAMIAPS